MAIHSKKDTEILINFSLFRRYMGRNAQWFDISILYVADKEGKIEGNK